MSVDFAVEQRVGVGSRDELRALLCDLGTSAKIRIAGYGTTQDFVPAPPIDTRGVTLVQLGGMARIERLDAGDFTCSVEPGLTPTALRAALDEVGLELPCVMDGATLGGVFARGDHGPLAPGAFSPRSLILGLEGVLAEGLAFKVGARVVKSVAGFDVQKLFVGSRGRLFAATLLHLKLRPRPQHVARFVIRCDDHAHATARFTEIRNHAAGPRALLLTRDAERGYVVCGEFAGRARPLAAQMATLGLCATDDLAALPSPPAATPQHPELLRGFVALSSLRRLLETVPAELPLRMTGGGQFDIRAAPAHSDILLDALPALGATAEILCAAPGRRGRSTGSDAASDTLRRDLIRALDPHDILT